MATHARITGGILLFICLLIAGCVTPSGTSDTWIREGVDLSQYQSIEVLPVTDSTGVSHDLEVSTLLTQLLHDKIESTGYLHKSEESKNGSVVKLQADLFDYEAGSALGRWAAPGAGKAKCVVRSVLVDAQSGQTVAEMVTVKEVSEGGLYSVGAEKYILDAAAEEIAERLSTYLRGEEA